jgi:hypothetical protein
MIEGAAKSGAPEDYIGTKSRAVGPAELPGASRLGRLIQHNESPVWHQPALLEVVSRGQAGLAGSDDDDVGLERDT